MPELPEVEVVKQGLQQILQEQPRLEKIEFKRRDLRDPMPIKKLKTLEGEKILRVERRAKYLLLWTTKGAMLSHLGMTGTWRVAPVGEERKHDHIYLQFPSFRLAYRDPRRFGILDFVALNGVARHPRLMGLGPEPLSAEFTGESLWQSLRRKKVAIKTAIMDQKVVVGVGNIYASESLFMAGVRPQLRADRLSLEKSALLAKSIREVLSKSIQFGGSTISDFAQAKGGQGYFQTQFQVYDRGGQSCIKCQTKIKKVVLGGRSTFFCSSCQK